MAFCALPCGISAPAARNCLGQRCLVITLLVLTVSRIQDAGGSRHSDDAEMDTRSLPIQGSDDKMHIVLSIYREDPADIASYIKQLKTLPNVARSQPQVYAYVKGGAEQAAAVKKADFADEVLEAPNVGREAETYFRHIVAHYEKLPAHILFTQAQPQYDYSVEMLGKYFGEKSGLLALSGVTVCSCEGFSYYWAGDKLGAKHGGFIRIRELWALFQGTLCPKEFSCSHNGIFVVSRPRILAQPKRLHQYVQSLFQVNRDDPLRHYEQNYHNNDQDAPAGEPGWYTLGHVLERSWMFVFNCTDPMVSNTCGNRCPGDPEDCTNVQQCQCLDE